MQPTSVFINNDYLIKGVAGAIFWKLASDYIESGRTEFGNRELRVEPTLRLPDISGDLKARLILLRAPARRALHVSAHREDRSRPFHLGVNRPVKLVETAIGRG